MVKGKLSAEEHRKHIIEKAAEAFSITGLSGTRVRDIADVCGVNESALYKHFVNKEDIFREVIITRYEAARKEILSTDFNSGRGQDALVILLDFQIELYQNDPILCACLMHGISSATHNDQMRLYIRDFLSAFNVFLKRQTNKGIEDGSICKDISPDMGASIIQGFLLTRIINNILSSSEDNQDQPNFKCTDLFMRLLSSEDGVCSKR